MVLSIIEMEKMCNLDVLLTYCRKYECILCRKYVLIVCHEHFQIEIAFEYTRDTRGLSCVCTYARFHFSFSPTGTTVFS